jgi:hypothetical protein
VTVLELDPGEAEEIYVLLKPREGSLPEILESLLSRVERSLFERLTIEEIEALHRRFAADR